MKRPRHRLGAWRETRARVLLESERQRAGQRLWLESKPNERGPFRRGRTQETGEPEKIQRIGFSAREDFALIQQRILILP